MTCLRALVGAGFLLAIIVTVVAAPLGWIIVLGLAEAYPEMLAAASLRAQLIVETDWRQFRRGKVSGTSGAQGRRGP